ncbi:MAG: alpha-amylase family glycosyl hydrolase [Blautia sp.]|nr:alpha-amylase family glycosyl hydrolase [Blautia sp.]MCM1201041.1 alpha-amylase family glycosyl hydrolase [Bacteroides fragilis]
MDKIDGNEGKNRKNRGRYRRALAAFLAFCIMFQAAGCGGNDGTQTKQRAVEDGTESGHAAGDGTEEEKAVQDNAAGKEITDVTDTIPLHIIDDNYRTYYEVFVYSFCDSDGDGIGDLQGLISRLDYINDGDDATDTDLGCNGIWLMPVGPSPTYHKYDVADYYDIDADYGTMEDFKELLAECDKRGIKVIMDLVLNHSSSRNPWFVDACAYLRELGDGKPDAQACPSFDYYHFSKEQGAGCYAVEGTDWYYEAQFWSEMPDLNLDSGALRAEIEKIAGFWLDMGVGGFRLDAVKEFYTGNPQANIAFLSWFAEMVREKKQDAYLVGEAWLDISGYAQYYESGIDSLFNFAFADKDGIISRVVNGSPASGYGSASASLQETFGQYNENYIDAPFYTNHDMGRSAGYYAGENSEAQTKLAGAMNLFMSGSAFLYYGEELGMKGSGKDENKRAPMYWSRDAEKEGMCGGPADMDDFQMKFDSLEEQEQSPDSIYQYYKKAIKIRNQNPEIARGRVEYLEELSGDSFCVLRKVWEGSEVLLVFHTGAETETLDMSGVTVNGTEISEKSIRGMLESGAEEIRAEGGAVTMPGYSVLVLK